MIPVEICELNHDAGGMGGQMRLHDASVKKDCPRQRATPVPLNSL